MAGVVPQTNWNNVADNGATSTGGAQSGTGEWNYIGVGFTAGSGPDANGAYHGSSVFTANANNYSGGSAFGYKPNAVSSLRIGADWTGAT
jgi:hypothetical protein